MFELGKKEGSESGTDGKVGADRQDSRRSGSAEAAAGARSDVAVIGRSIQIDGDLRGEEDLRIEGDVNGTVRLHNNTLTIGSEGKIRADVFAKAIIVDGTMEGDLTGSERVSIRRNATVLGNITAPRVSLEDGARFKGSIEMDSEAVKAVLEKSGVAAKSSPKSEGTKSEGPKSEDKGKSNGEHHTSQSKVAPNGSGAAHDSAD